MFFPYTRVDLLRWTFVPTCTPVTLRYLVTLICGCWLRSRFEIGSCCYVVDLRYGVDYRLFPYVVVPIVVVLPVVDLRVVAPLLPVAVTGCGRSPVDVVVTLWLRCIHPDCYDCSFI